MQHHKRTFFLIGIIVILIVLITVKHRYIATPLPVSAEIVQAQQHLDENSELTPLSPQLGAEQAQHKIINPQNTNGQS